MAVSDLIQKATTNPRLLDTREVQEKTRKGWDWELAEEIKRLLEITDEQLANLLGIGERTVTRRRQKIKEGEKVTLTTNESSNLIRIIRVFIQAKEVLGNEDSARSWLKREQPGLDHERPIDILTTDPGTRRVERLLGQIEHTVII